MPEKARIDLPTGATLADELRRAELKLHNVDDTGDFGLTLLAAAHAAYGRDLKRLVSGRIAPSLAVWALARAQDLVKRSTRC